MEKRIFYVPPRVEVFTFKPEGVVCASVQSSGWFTNAAENDLSGLFEDK